MSQRRSMHGKSMHARKQPSCRRKRTEGGNNIVEAALVFLPLMALFFAMIDIPFGIFIQNTLKEAVREGVRYAITQQAGSGTQLASILAQSESYSMGYLNATAITAGTATFKVQFYNGTTLAAYTLWDASIPGTKPAAVGGIAANAQGNICVVTATVSHSWMAPVWQSTSPLTFAGASSDVMEAPPGGVLPSL